MSHVYRSHAADQGRQNGWLSFCTVKNKAGTWDVMHLPGGDAVGKVAGDFAFAHNEWCAWGEVNAGPTRADAGPELVGALVVKCRYEQLKQHGDVLVDRTLAKLWLRPADCADLYLVMPMDGERWSLFGSAPTLSPEQREAAALGEQNARMASRAEDARKPAAPRAPRAATGGASTAESPTKKVWAIADAMPGASRAEIVAACVEQGINKSTAGTQYYHWKTAGGAGRLAAAGEA